MGKKYGVTSLSAANGRYAGAALGFVDILWSQGVDCGSPLVRVSYPVPPPPTHVLGTSWVPFIWLGVCKGFCISGRSGQDAGKRHLRLGKLARTGLLQQALPSTEGDGGWQPTINLLSLNNFITLTKFNMETVVSVLGLIRKGDMMLSIDFKDGYFQIPNHLHSRPYLRIVLHRRVCQFKVLCVGLSSAPLVFTRLFGLVSEWAHQRGILLPCYLDDWLAVAESVPLPLQHGSLLL